MNNLTPSSSTVASSVLGIPAAVILVWLLQAFAKIEVPAEVATAMGALLSAGIGYFFKGGKSNDMV